MNRAQSEKFSILQFYLRMIVLCRREYPYANGRIARDPATKNNVATTKTGV